MSQKDTSSVTSSGAASRSRSAGCRDACRPRRRSRRTACRGCSRASISACGPTACSPTSRSTSSATISRSASRPTRQRSRRGRIGTNFATGAAWDAFDLARQKPQVTAQATYYVPDNEGSHDLKFGFEYLLDISKYTIDGRSGPIQYRDLNGATDRDPVRRHRQERRPRQHAGRGGNNRDQRYAGYAQDRWNLNNRTTITAGAPLGLPAAVLPGRQTRSDHQGRADRRPSAGVPDRPADVPGPIVPTSRRSSPGTPSRRASA